MNIQDTFKMIKMKKPTKKSSEKFDEDLYDDDFEDFDFGDDDGNNLDVSVGACGR